MELEGGTFQKLFDEYLYKKYKFDNIQTLGSHTGTNKTTKGTPDSYVLTKDGKYILINYGSVSSQPAKKIKDDILSCFNKAKVLLPKKRIEKIICGHCSTNINIQQYSSITEAVEGVKIELIGIDTLSHDLALIYPHIAKDILGIEIDTNQFFDIEDFVKAYDANGINAPIDCEFLYRDAEISEVCKSVRDNIVTILTGPSGIGKTRLALEVCRKQDNETVNVYCVKSNGNLLYEDIRYYIDGPGKYLIFLDDANMVVSLDNVLHTILTLPKEYEVNIIITVRDYARDRVANLVAKYSQPNIIEIGRFKDNEIKDILKNDLGILNQEYLKRVTEIANGNIRLAFLAGIRSIDAGYQAIRNAEDIFKNYYGRVINDAKLEKDDIMMLFFIAVAGPVKKNENQLYSDLKKLYGDEIIESNTIEKLYSLELIDWFKNEITKIADQSFGNYIMYYVLFEKRWIDVESLITIGFPDYRNKVIYVLNTLLELFESEELEKYVKESIITAWNSASAGQEMEYLESFYQIDAEKALYIIKNHIEQEKTVEFDLHNFDINSKKNYYDISTKEIEILGGYKYTEYFEDAVDLLLLYLTKRPDLIMDFYFVFSRKLLYDKYSWKNKYNREQRLLDKLWNATENGKNYNSSILYLQISEDALRTEISFTEEVRHSHSVNFVRMSLGFNEEIATIHENILRNLAILRNNSEYYNSVNRILLEVHFEGLNEEESGKYLKRDFDVIYERVINKNKPDFFDARIVAKYKKMAEKIGIPIDDRFRISAKNMEFKIYRMLSSEHLLGRSVKDDEKIRRDYISKEIDSYDLCDYQRLFDACCFLEGTLNERDQWSLDGGLNCIFEILENDSDLYIKVLTEYFNANAPFRLNGYCQTKYLIDHMGYDATYELLNSKDFNKKKMWLSLIWECLPEESINEKVVDDYKEFMLSNLAGDNPIVPKVETVNKYGNKDREFKERVIEAIVARPEVSNEFLDYVYDDDKIAAILRCFRGNIVALEKIYMNAIKNSNYVDYDGKLFIKIFEQCAMIWKEYIDWIKDDVQKDAYEQKIFEMIWNSEKWCECIDYAFSVLIDDNIGFSTERSARLLFSKTQDDITSERKKEWLLAKLHERSLHVEKCRKLIDVVVTIMPEWKLEFIIEFLKDNKKIEDFKRIHLFPLSSSWSGSEVPLILEKIEFIKVLKDRLKGIDYIEHKKYLEDMRRSLEKYKEAVELREYIEDADYT